MRAPAISLSRAWIDADGTAGHVEYSTAFDSHKPIALTDYSIAWFSNVHHRLCGRVFLKRPFTMIDGIPRYTNYRCDAKDSNPILMDTFAIFCATDWG